MNAQPDTLTCANAPSHRLAADDEDPDEAARLGAALHLVELIAARVGLQRFRCHLPPVLGATRRSQLRRRLLRDLERSIRQTPRANANAADVLEWLRSLARLRSLLSTDSPSAARISQTLARFR